MLARESAGSVFTFPNMAGNRTPVRDSEAFRYWLNVIQKESGVYPVTKRLAESIRDTARFVVDNDFKSKEQIAKSEINYAVCFSIVI